MPLPSQESNLDFALHAGVQWDCSIPGDGNHSSCEGDRAISIAALKHGPFLLVVLLFGGFGIKMSLN